MRTSTIQNLTWTSSVLRDIALDKTIREVGGSLQIAKVYKSGRSEFFGILWPSSQANPISRVENITIIISLKLNI